MSQPELFAQFVEFVGNKPKHEQYDFHDINNCAIAQFGRSLYPEAERITAGAWGFTALIDDKLQSFSVLDPYGSVSAFHSNYGTQTFGKLHNHLVHAVYREQRVSLWQRVRTWFRPTAIAA